MKTERIRTEILPEDILSDGEKLDGMYDEAEYVYFVKLNDVWAVKVWVSKHFYKRAVEIIRQYSIDSVVQKFKEFTWNDDPENIEFMGIPLVFSIMKVVKVSSRDVENKIHSYLASKKFPKWKEFFSIDDQDIESMLSDKDSWFYESVLEEFDFKIWEINLPTFFLMYGNYRNFDIFEYLRKFNTLMLYMNTKRNEW